MCTDHLEDGDACNRLGEVRRVDSLVYKEIPDPEPKAGHVVIEIKAFGINHAEMHMRRGEWAEAAKVIGIESFGLVKFERNAHA